MNNDYHVQVLVTKNDEFFAAWVPEEVVTESNVLKFRNEDGTWDDGWEIVKVYKGTRFQSKYIIERSQDYKKTRKASDI